MAELFVKLTPLTEAVFSKNAVTMGQHQTHNIPTGSAIWGAIIHSINRLKKHEALKDIVRPNSISVSNGFPIYNDKLHFPRPNNLYAPKNDITSFDENGQMDSEKICVGRGNYKEKFSDTQGEVISKFYTPADLSNVLKLNTNHRLRTAIEDRKAKKGQLFGYESTLPGNDFVCIIDCNNIDLIKEALGSRIFLGKARLNGYGGGYKVEILNEFKFPNFSSKQTSVKLWCLSDLCLENEFGAPLTNPSSEIFNLTGGKLNHVESDISIRRFAPWDRAEGGRSKEIVVIEAGSVIAYDDVTSIPENFGATPFGKYKNRGFGWVGIVPECPVTSAPIKISTSIEKLKCDHKLALWATNYAKDNDLTALYDIRKTVESTVDAWFKSHKNNWPSRSQWSIISNANRANIGSENLVIALGRANDDKKPLDGKSWTDGTDNLRDRLFELISSQKELTSRQLQFCINELVRVAKTKNERG